MDLPPDFSHKPRNHHLRQLGCLLYDDKPYKLTPMLNPDLSREDH